MSEHNVHANEFEFKKTLDLLRLVEKVCTLSQSSHPHLRSFNVIFLFAVEALTGNRSTSSQHVNLGKRGSSRRVSNYWQTLKYRARYRCKLPILFLVAAGQQFQLMIPLKTPRRLCFSKHWNWSIRILVLKLFSVQFDM